MIHARTDYQRFQEPSALLQTVGFLESCIKAGEQLSPEDEARIGRILKEYGDDIRLSADALIGENEPVFLLRAQDKYFLPMLRMYRELLRQDYARGHTMVESVERHMQRALDWQGEHIAVKMADLVQELIDEQKLEPEQVAEGIGATLHEVNVLYNDSIFKQRNLDNYKYSKAWRPIETKGATT